MHWFGVGCAVAAGLSHGCFRVCCNYFFLARLFLQILQLFEEEWENEVERRSLPPNEVSEALELLCTLIHEAHVRLHLLHVPHLLIHHEIDEDRLFAY